MDVWENRFMTVIRCTQKLLDEMGPKASKLPAPSNVPGWHANVFRIERHKCVLFTHDESLFSVFIPWLHKEDFLSLGETFSQRLFKTLLWHEFPQEQMEVILDTLREIQYGKSNNRSVLGTMNELRFQIEYFASDSGGLENLDLVELHFRINQMLFSANGSKHPVEALKAISSDVSRNMANDLLH
jgi:hypothetical protein